MPTVWALDPAGVRVGTLKTTAVSLVLRDCGVGTWQITAHGDRAFAVDKGWALVIVDETGTVMSGPVLDKGTIVEEGKRARVLTGRSHLMHPANDIVYPIPSKGWGDQGDAAYYAAKGPADTLIADLVRSQIGQGARADRRVPRFTVATPPGTAPRSSINARFGVVLDEAAALAQAGGLAFDAVWEQAAGGVVFRIRERVDRSRAVRFTGRNGGSGSTSYSLVAPTATVVLIAGQGQGADRTLRQYDGDDDGWGLRIVQFKDRRDTDDNDEHDKAGAEALAEGAATATASFEATETVGRVLGVDYQIGDTVTAMFGDDVTITERVTEAQITYTEHRARQVQLKLGNYDQTTDPDAAMRKKIRDLEGRIQRMENL